MGKAWPEGRQCPLAIWEFALDQVVNNHITIPAELSSQQREQWDGTSILESLGCQWQSGLRELMRPSLKKTLSMLWCTTTMQGDIVPHQ